MFTILAQSIIHKGVLYIIQVSSLYEGKTIGCSKHYSISQHAMYYVSEYVRKYMYPGAAQPSGKCGGSGGTFFVQLFIAFVGDLEK